MSQYTEYKKTSIPWRPLIYGLVILYLVIDIGIWRGPVKKWIDQKVKTESLDERAKRFGYAATVNSLPISCREVERTAREFLAQSNRTLEELSPFYKNTLMIASLERLKQKRLVSRFSHFSGGDDSTDTSLEPLARVLTGGEEELKQRIQGIVVNPGHFKNWYRQQQRHYKWIEKKIKNSIQVNESEVNDWYNNNKEQLEIPETIKVRHIFVTTSDPKRPNAEERIEKVYEALMAGESFEKISASYSDDPRTKNKGGDLGWLSRERIPPAFSGLAFQIKPGNISEPFQTKLGWHCIRVDEKQPPRIPDFNEVRNQIFAYLENQKREHAIPILIKNMKENSTIVHFPEIFDEYVKNL